MAFRLKGANRILEDLINWVSTQTDKLTDFNIGSATRTLLESVALEVEEYYYNLDKAVRHAIKNAGYEAFGFKKKAATTASGYVTIFYEKQLSQPIIIEKGTQFHTGDNRITKTYYRSLETVVVEVGAQAALVKVECEKEGSIGNAIAGEICKISMGTPNIFNIANTYDFVNGKDEETEAQRELRFREYVHTLQRGTAEAIAYGIKQVPGVSGVYVDDNYIGYVRVYAHDRDGNLSNDLKEKVNEAVDQYRSAGIEVEVKPIFKRSADVDIDVVYKKDVNAKLYDGMIYSLIHDYITELKASEKLSISSLVSYIYDNYSEAISYINLDKTKDIDIQKNEILIPGDIKVNQKNNRVEEGY